MTFDLGIKGRRALVTGATKCIGAAVIDVLRESGVRVMGTARSVPETTPDDMHYVAGWTRNMYLLPRRLSEADPPEAGVAVR